MKEPSVVIVVLNWNGGLDTCECLFSLARMSYSNFKVVVVDNASSDNSVELIEQAILRITQQAPQSQYKKIWVAPNTAAAHADVSLECKYTLLISPDNGGFAAGNNHGIRAAIANPTIEYIWLLNNDVEVDVNALSALVHRAQLGTQSAVGSVLVFHDTRNTVQCIGGVQFDIARAAGVQIGQGELWSNTSKLQEPKQLSYVAGASMLVSTDTVRKGGLMDEKYFLYFEELDWAYQLSAFGAPVVATNSIVFHKEGASIGTASRGRRSTTSHYYLARNLVLFYKKRFPHLLAIALIRNLREALRYFELKDASASKTILAATVHGLFGNGGKRT